MDNFLKNISLNNSKENNDAILNEPLYVLTIELKEGKRADLKIFLDSNPEGLAFDFCKENNLDYDSMSFLTGEIKQLLENINRNIQNQIENECIEEVEEENNNTQRNTTNVLNSKDNIQKDKKFICSDYNSKKKECENNHSNINSNSNNNKVIMNQKTSNIVSYNAFYNNIKKKINDENAYKKRKNKDDIFLHYKDKDNHILKNKSYCNFTKGKQKEKNITKEKPNNDTLNNNKDNFIYHQKTQQSTTPSHYSFTIPKNTFTNFGERLYEKGLQLKEKENKKIENLKKTINDKEKQNITFNPILNSKSLSIIKKNPTSKYRINKNTLLHYKSQIETKMEKLKEKHKPQNFTFTPTFNKKSLNIENAKNINRQERIGLLYKSGKFRNRKLRKIESDIYSDYSFTPQLTEYPNGNLNNLSFNERQSIYRSRSLEKITKIIEREKELTDKQTGQPLFHPKMSANCSYSYIQSRQGKDVFNTLYSYANKYKIKREESEEILYKKEKEKRRLKLNIKSENLMVKRQREIFNKIFSLLDKDSDEQITILSMDLNKLPPTIVNILHPVFDLMKKEESPVKRENFVNCCMDLFEMLNYNQRQTLFNFNNEFKKKKDKIQNNWTFHPKINSNSRKIANQNLNLSGNIMPLSYNENESYFHFIKKPSTCNTLHSIN